MCTKLRRTNESSFTNMSSFRVHRKSPSLRSPCFVQNLEAIAVRSGGSASLECRVSGFPKPDVRWERKGQMVANSRCIHTDRAGDKCLLQIKSIQLNDAGPYSCIATSIMGSAVSTAEVTVYSGNERCGRSAKPPVVKGEKNCLRSDVASKKDCKIQQRVSSLNRRNETIRAVSVSPSRPKNTSIRCQVFPQVNESKHETSFLRIKDYLCRRPITERTPLRQTPKPNIPEGPRVSSIKKTEKTSSQRVDQQNLKPPLIRKVPSINVKKIEGSSGGKDKANVKSVGSGKGALGVHVTCKSNLKSSNSARIKENKLPRTEGKSVLPIGKSPSKQHSAKDETKNRTKEITSPGDRGKLIRQKKITDEESSNGHFIASRNKAEVRKSRGAEETESKNNALKSRENNVSHSKALGTENVVNSSGDHYRPQLPNSTPSKEFLTHKTLTNLDDHPVTENVLNQANQTIPPCCGIEGRKTQFNDLGDSVLKKALSEAPNVPKTTFSEVQKASSHLNKTVLVPTDGSHSVEGKVSSIAERKTEERLGGFEIKASLPVTKTRSPVGERGENRRELDSAENDKNRGGRKIGSHRESDFFPIRPCTGSLRYNNSVIEEECECLVKSGVLREVEADEERGARDAAMHHVESSQDQPVRIVKGPQSVTVLRGESVTLAAHFTGVPQPHVTWAKGGKTLGSDGRVSILVGRDMSVLTICDVTADDSGKYVVNVENSGGGDSCFASMAVVGIPEPPGGQPTACDVTDHSLVLSWYGSMYDGGSVVTGYVIEMCTLPGRHWHRISNCVNTSYVIQGLSQGQQYVFRVRAENRYGLSNPSQESEAVFVEDNSVSWEEWDNPPSPVQVEAGSRFSEQFELKEEVGKGRFGTVYRCIERTSGRPRAAKIIRCLKSKDKVKVQQEIDVMNRLHHPKLMHILAAFESGRNMIMVMEFISGGELFERVIADDFILTEHDCVLFMQQICDGVAYMHKSSILHLDLKPENILCKTRTSHQIKIIDFGLARLYNPEENLRVLFGTPEFVAPEVINYEPVLPASDMWSVGVVCYVLLSGLSPFMGDSDPETFANITRGEVDFDDEAFDTISENAKDFISKLLIKRCGERMSAEDCLKHTWLIDVKWETQDVPLSTEKLKKFIVRRKWQKTGTAIRALGRMVSLSRSSMGSSVSLSSPLASPKAVLRSQSEISRSETSESGFSELSRDSSISELLS